MYLVFPIPMGKKNKDLNQGTLFDDGLHPVIDYGTTAKDIEELYSRPQKISSSPSPINHAITKTVAPSGTVRQYITEYQNRLKLNLTDAQVKQATTVRFKKIVMKQFPQIKYRDGWMSYNGRDVWKNAFTQYPPEQRVILVQKRLDGRTPVTSEGVIAEIQTIKEAGASQLESVFGYFPFHFSSSKFIDHEKTLKEFSLTEQIEAYIKMYDQQDKDERYQKILPTIERYFKTCYFRDGKRESLQEYKDRVGQLAPHLQDKILIGLDGRLDINNMVIVFGRDTTKNIVEKIIKQESPYNDEILRDCLNQFFQQVGIDDKIHILAQKRENLVLLFQELSKKLREYDLDIEDFGKFYSMIFNDIEVANVLLRKKENFDTLRDEYLISTQRSYDQRYTDLIQEIIQSLLNDNTIETLKSIKHKTAMFMSYQKLNSDKNIDNLYKIHLVRDYIQIQSLHSLKTDS